MKQHSSGKNLERKLKKNWQIQTTWQFAESCSTLQTKDKKIKKLGKNIKEYQV